MKPVAHPIQLAVGPVLWFAWFSALYGGMSVACSVAPPPAEQGPFTWINGLLLAFTAVTAAGFAWAAWRSARARLHAAEGIQQGRDRFLGWVAALVHGASAFATLFVGLPLALLAPCV